MGRFTAQKNHAFLIDVFTEVAKRRDDAVLLLVGTGEAGASVKALVDERGLTDRVKFLGQRSDVNRLYQAFDAFVLPSLYEGLGLVGVEAQVSGLPCLLSDAITREVDVTGGCGFLPIDSPIAWADEINTLSMKSPEERLSISSGLFADYNIDLQGRRLSQKYLDLYSRN